MNLQQRLIDQLRSSYPGLASQPRELLESKISDHLLCPFEIRLPAHLRDEMQAIVSAFASLRSAVVPSPEFPNPGNRSIMSSYDFHVNSNGQLKLIEINTNASFLIMGAEMYRLRGIKAPFDYSASVLRDDILRELSLAGLSVSSPRVTITDEKPSEQRLFIEFLVTQEWIRSLGWNCEIRDVCEALLDKPDFIYNRSTDFLLERAPELREAFLKKTACVSPNPFEYLLMADKQRLIEWSRPGGLDAFGLSAEVRKVLEGTLLKCLDLSTATHDELWAKRKHLFFKPKREFGSKKAFRGASISHRVFEEMLTEDPIAQEYVPAPEIVFETPNGPKTFKWDLRCHAYDGRIEGLVARVYQGQVTNLKTEFGGFAPVVF